MPIKGISYFAEIVFEGYLIYIKAQSKAMLIWMANNIQGIEPSKFGWRWKNECLKSCVFICYDINILILTPMLSPVGNMEIIVKNEFWCCSPWLLRL